MDRVIRRRDLYSAALHRQQVGDAAKEAADDTLDRAALPIRLTGPPPGDAGRGWLLIGRERRYGRNGGGRLRVAARMGLRRGIPGRQLCGPLELLDRSEACSASDSPESSWTRASARQVAKSTLATSKGVAEHPLIDEG